MVAQSQRKVHKGSEKCSGKLPYQNREQSSFEGISVEEYEEDEHSSQDYAHVLQQEDDQEEDWIPGPYNDGGCVEQKV